MRKCRPDRERPCLPARKREPSDHDPRGKFWIPGEGRFRIPPRAADPAGGWDFESPSEARNASHEWPFQLLSGHEGPRPLDLYSPRQHCCTAQAHEDRLGQCGSGRYQASSPSPRRSQGGYPWHVDHGAIPEAGERTIWSSGMIRLSRQGPSRGSVKITLAFAS